MTTEVSPPQTDANRSITQVIYALYALSLVFGITSIVAVVFNYIKRDDVVGTIYESHFTWQIRTFWYSLLWGVIGGILTLVVIGIPILVVACIWFIYRVAKGWLRLTEGKAMYVVP